MRAEAVPQVANVRAVIEVAPHLRVDVGDGDHLVVHPLHHQHGHGRSLCAGTNFVQHSPQIGVREHGGNAVGRVPIGIAARESGQQRNRGGDLGTLQELEVSGRKMAAQYRIQLRVGPAQTGGEDHGEARERRTVEPHERRGRVTHRGARDRADDIEFRGVFGREFGSPSGGESATGIAPQADSSLGVQPERVEAQGSPGGIEGTVAGLAGRAEVTAEPFVIGHRYRPAALQRGGDERQFELRNRPEGTGAMP